MMLKQVVLGVSMLAMLGGGNAQRFSADSANGVGPGARLTEPFQENIAAADMADPAEPDAILERQGFNAVRIFSRTCGCVRRSDDELMPENIRAISDITKDGNAVNSFGLSNMVWSFGQFIDHDVALGIEDVRFGRRFEIGSAIEPFTAERDVATFRRGCPATLNIHTAQIDAGMIYGTDPIFLRDTLRLPNSCNLRAAIGQGAEFPPVTTFADELGRFFFLAGDIRISEHSFLFSQHTVWLREHNRLCDVARTRSPSLTENQLFDLVQSVVIAKLQQVVLTEFLPALGISQAELEATERLINTPDTSTEFSMAYRMGHDLVPNMVGDIYVADTFMPESVFLNVVETPEGPEVSFRPDADTFLDSLVRNLATSPANELDGKISDAIRNTLFGRIAGEDLVGRNIFRSRDVALPTYAGLAECFGITPDAATEAETPDAWIGLVREPRIPGGIFGPTQRAIIVEQFHRSFFGPGGLFWRDTASALGSFLPEVEQSTYATILAANTGVPLSGNVFMV
eukprot:jgi/Ulvmu1/3585/UM169_0003.1